MVITPIGLLFLSLSGPSYAEAPLPSYRQNILSEVWREINEMIVQEHYEAALQRAKTFQRHVTEDAALTYLMGESYRQLGQTKKAEQAFRRSLQLEPTRQDAWYDLGEILLEQQRLDEAKTAFQRVSELVHEGPNAWIAPFRLAEIAAAQKQPEIFEEQLRKALSLGFSFQTVAGLPNWQGYYRDPVIHDSLNKLITVYGSVEIQRSLEAVPDKK